MEIGDTEYAQAKDIENTLRATVTILNKVNPVLDENILVYLTGRETVNPTLTVGFWVFVWFFFNIRWHINITQLLILSDRRPVNSASNMKSCAFLFFGFL